ncbi:hypothetical protein LX36DRAFT_650792 [Colletotrichum falcatum]|nr:hypothetical protein LX36DRAFT_650792 [Colletotrichum falcatum]
MSRCISCQTDGRKLHPSSALPIFSPRDGLPRFPTASQCAFRVIAPSLRLMPPPNKDSQTKSRYLPASVHHEEANQEFNTPMPAALDFRDLPVWPTYRVFSQGMRMRMMMAIASSTKAWC